jgi:hypothetical protein
MQLGSPAVAIAATLEVDPEGVVVAQGILVGLLICLPFWGCAALAIWQTLGK